MTGARKGIAVDPATHPVLGFQRAKRAAGSMIYRVAADAVVLVHLAFVLYVALGGLLVLRWPRTAWLHIPCAVWGVWIEWSGGICPLTPLENTLRARGGEAGYPGGFVEHYLIPVLYPIGLTSHLQIVLGALVVAFNILVYGWLWRTRRRRATREH